MTTIDCGTVLIGMTGAWRTIIAAKYAANKEHRMEFALYAGLVALGVFALFASCGAVAHVPVAPHIRIYNGRQDAARRP